jgi:hypothetical protein
VPGFSASVCHSLGKEEATTRLKGFVEDMRTRFRDEVSAAHGTWTGNVLDFSLTAMGMTVNGTLVVEDKKAKVDGQLPFAALPFRGRIEKSIVSELSTVLT